MRAASIAAVLLLAGCPEHGKSPDGGSGGPDGPRGFPDAASLCPNPADTRVAGEILDLDSTTTLRMPVADVALAIDPNVAIVTGPGGRFDECVQARATMSFAYDAPGTYLDGTLVLMPQALFGARSLSLRLIDAQHAPSFYSDLGLTFDPAKAHVLVFQAGDRVDLTLDISHGAPQSANDDALPGTFGWIPGAAGRYVLFPNVDTSAQIGRVGFAEQTIDVPLAAGTLTLVAVDVPFI